MTKDNIQERVDMPKPRLALVGVGPWGKNYLNILGKSLVAVVDTDPAVRWKISNSGIPAFASLDELFTAALPIDGVIIASPAQSHFELAYKTLRSGIGALVEKPLAGSFEEATQLYEIASANEVTLMAGHLLLHHRGLQRLWQAAHEGSIGKIMNIRSTRIGLGRIRREEDVWWSFGVHDLVLLLTLTRSMPTSVIARKVSLRGTPQADLVTAELAFDGDVTGSIYASWLGPEREHRLLVYGTGASARWDDGQSDNLGLLIQPVPSLESAVARNAQSSLSSSSYAGPSPLEREIMLFSANLLKRATPEEDKAIALAVMALLELADMSSNSGGARLKLEDTAAGSNSQIDPDKFKPSNAWTPVG